MVRTQKYRFGVFLGAHKSHGADSNAHSELAVEAKFSCADEEESRKIHGSTSGDFDT